MRLFVAVELDPSARAAVAAAGQAVRAGVPGDVTLRWIPEDNIHITLWFLGEVADAQVPWVTEALGVPFERPSFSISLGGLGAFPRSGPPRVLWMGIGDGAAELAMLHDDLAARLEPLGFEGEKRPYSAHVTLARVKDPGRRRSQDALRRALAGWPAAAARSPVGELTLFRSRLSPNGAQYEPVLRVPLNR